MFKKRKEKKEAAAREVEEQRYKEVENLLDRLDAVEKEPDPVLRALAYEDFAGYVRGYAYEFSDAAPPDVNIGKVAAAGLGSAGAVLGAGAALMPLTAGFSMVAAVPVALVAEFASVNKVDDSAKNKRAQYFGGHMSVLYAIRDVAHNLAKATLDSNVEGILDSPHYSELAESDLMQHFEKASTAYFVEQRQKQKEAEAEAEAEAAKAADGSVAEAADPAASDEAGTKPAEKETTETPAEEPAAEEAPAAEPPAPPKGRVSGFRKIEWN